MKPIDVDKHYLKWKNKSVEDRRDFVKILNSKIVAIDNNSKGNYQYFSKHNRYRNSLVEIKLKIEKDLPRLYQPGDEVILQLDKKRIKAVVLGYKDNGFNTVRIKPNDTVYKETVGVPENWLSPAHADEVTNIGIKVTPGQLALNF